MKAAAVNPEGASELSRAAAVATSISVCAVAAAAGALLSGDSPTDHLEQIDQPWFAIPIEAWVGVGIAYYSICGFVLYRLIRLTAPKPLTLGVFILTMAGNEAWNYLFFNQSASAALIGMAFYAALSTIAALFLRSTDDRPALLGYLPYAVWVIAYDVPWMTAIWAAPSQ